MLPLGKSPWRPALTATHSRLRLTTTCTNRQHHSVIHSRHDHQLHSQACSLSMFFTMKLFWVRSQCKSPGSVLQHPCGACRAPSPPLLLSVSSSFLGAAPGWSTASRWPHPGCALLCGGCTGRWPQPDQAATLQCPLLLASVLHACANWRPPFLTQTFSHLHHLSRGL